MAPLQGFTDFLYRRCYHTLFGSVDEYYIPYIALGPGQKIRNSQYREILPENNKEIPVVPQILCSNTKELKQLATEIKNFGYNKINLNLGCPYPMATKRGRGTGLLENPDELKEVLDSLFTDFDFVVSAKLRSGLTNDQTIINQVDLLNAYPFEKLIFHPRTAQQMYKGLANRPLFAELKKLVKVPLVYNGDILSSNDIDELKKLVPEQNDWMIGRGILSNPFLPDELKGVFLTKEQKHEKLIQFHALVLESYQSVLQNDEHILRRMQAFWSYFSTCFPNPRKAFKPVKKAQRLSSFLKIYSSIFKDF